MADKPTTESGKPTLHLSDPRTMTFDHVMDLFRKLTGREPTPEEIEKAKVEWKEWEKDAPKAPDPPATLPFAPHAEETTNEAWNRFVADLSLCLSDLNEDEFLIISCKRANYFIQFAGQGRFGMRAEAVCNSYIEQADAKLSTEDYAEMTALGWRLPTRPPEGPRDPDGSPNFFVDAPYPVDCPQLAKLAAATFRRVYRVTHPGALQYKAFATGGDSIRFPTLRIKRED